MYNTIQPTASPSGKQEIILLSTLSISLILYGINITGNKEVKNIITPTFQSSDKVLSSAYLILSNQPTSVYHHLLPNLYGDKHLYSEIRWK